MQVRLNEEEQLEEQPAKKSKGKKGKKGGNQQVRYESLVHFRNYLKQRMPITDKFDPQVGQNKYTSFQNYQPLPDS